jgi:TPR repeat protein
MSGLFCRKLDNEGMPTSAIPSSSLPATPTSVQDLQALSPQQWQAVLAHAPEQASRWMTAAARLGHPGAQAVLGQWLLDGHGQARNPTQALTWFLHAAQQGHAMGMNMMGRCHEQGWGTAVDPDKAAHWYRHAVALGLPEARYNLANLLASGSGVAQDHAQALALYQQAAEQGYVKAFAKLGRYHEDGLVVDKDPEMAFLCYQRGAEGGDFRGQFCYAGMLATQGREDEALQWLAKVPDTATPSYLKQAGELLLQSPHPAFRAMGQQMVARSSL